MSQAEPRRQRGRKHLVAAILMAIALRVAVMVAGTGQFDDPDNYLPLARSVAAGEGLSLNGRFTAYRPPLYPILLAPFVTLPGEMAVRGIALLHIVLGAATVGLTMLTARRWGLGERRALVAALIVAVDPVLLWQSRFVMTETLTAFLLVAALAALTLPRWPGSVLGGVLFGLAGLCAAQHVAGRGADDHGRPHDQTGCPQGAAGRRTDDGALAACGPCPLGRTQRGRPRRPRHDDHARRVYPRAGEQRGLLS